jgi:hypothetical protein
MFLPAARSFFSQVKTGIDFLPVDSRVPCINAGARSTLQWERTQAWTAICKIKIAKGPTSVGPGAAIIFTTCNQGTGAGNTYTGYEFWIEYKAANVWVLRVRIISNYGGPNYIGVIGTINVCDGKWHTVAASYDGSSTAAGVKLYVDGVVDAQTTESDTLTTTIVNKEPLWIGNQRDWTYSLGGALAEFMLSNVVRTQAWIQKYDRAKASVDSSTVLAYDFSEGRGKIVKDLSSNGFDGSVCSAVWANSNEIGRAGHWIQGKFSADPGLSASASLAATFSTAVGQGNAVVGCVTLAASPNTPTISVADDKGNSYTVLGHDRTLAGTLTAYFYGINLAGGPTVITATLSTGTGTYWRVVVDEFKNIAQVSAIDGNANAYSAAASGTDGASSGNLSATPSVNYDIIYGVATNYSAAYMNPGTGFTALMRGATTDNEPLWSEYMFQAQAGAVAAKFTPGASSSTVIVGLALKSL